jgi:hypothetical protein
MNRRRLIQLAGVVLLCAAATLAGAQALEIIALRHRTADQVLPALRPLLEPGGTLSAHSNQLIIRTSPANLAEIRRALETIDRPARRLQISVRFASAQQAAGRDVAVRGAVGDRGSRIEVRGRDSNGAAEDRIDQRLFVLDGGRALIYAGESRAFPQGQHTVIQEVATGLEVVPRLAGDLVMLEIAPQREMQDAVQRVATTLAIRLGVWTEIGGVQASASRHDRGIATASRAGTFDSRRIWLKVEQAPN